MITTQNRVQQQLHGNQIQQNTAQIKPIPTISLSQMNAGAATSRTPTLVYTTSNATNYTATRVVSTNSLVNPVPVNISKSLVSSDLEKISERLTVIVSFTINCIFLGSNNDSETAYINRFGFYENYNRTCVTIEDSSEHYFNSHR